MNDDDTKVKCPKCTHEETNYWIKKWGHCVWCQFKIEDEQRKKHECEDAIKEGEGKSKVGIICPHCGYMIEDDLQEFDRGIHKCDECNKEFELEIEWTATYSTCKVEGDSK
jgi:DNA-directed RNA polymerase subunit M/transcription elongation factor TFIIS